MRANAGDIAHAQDADMEIGPIQDLRRIAIDNVGVPLFDQNLGLAGKYFLLLGNH